MSKIFILLLSLNLLSCASYRPPEAFEAKMNRFAASSGEKNIVPNLYTQPLLLDEGRTPASVSRKGIKPLNYSNRILYFIGLYGQYKTMRNFASASTPIIKSCPHFHSTIIKNKTTEGSYEFIVPRGADFEKISQLYKNAKNNPGLFPELHLPLEKGNNKNTVFTHIKNDKDINEVPYQIQTAVNIHLEKTYGEIKELCLSGTSSNYFIYENLTRFQKNKKLKKSEKTLKAFFKTTLVSNMAILTSLQSWSKSKRSLKIEQINSEIMKRLEGKWISTYLEKLIERRKKLTLN
jgi:hypothetical protein